jgi:hypothetical protein
VTDNLKNALFYFPEEELSPLGPNEASILINSIERAISVYRGIFLQKYYDERNYNFKEELALQEYKDLLRVSKQFDIDFGDKYEKIKKELGSAWSELNWYEYIYFDRLGSAVMDIMTWNKASLNILSEAQKQRIKLMAELDYCNFADKLCGLLNIEFQKVSSEVKEKNKEGFFAPEMDQYLFAIQAK